MTFLFLTLLKRVKFNYKDAVFSPLDPNTTSSLISFNINPKFTSSLLDTNDTSSYSIIDITGINSLKTDNNTRNFSLFEVKDIVDDRDFIFAKYGKNVYVNSNGYNVRNVVKYPTNDYYLSTNNTGSTTVTFTSSYDLIQSIGSGSGE